MKKIIEVVIVLILITCYGAFAQNTPRANTRQKAQQVRIAEGVASGQLTQAERQALKTEQRHIRRTERRAKADGEVTMREKRNIERKQDRANRHIRRQKRDSENAF